MTLLTIAEIVAERAGRQQDIPFQDECADWAVAHRAIVLTSILSVRPQLKKQFSKAIVVDLIEVNKDECESIDECTCSDVLKTKTTIPPTLKIGPNPFDFVGSPGGYVSYGWTTFGSEPFLACNKFTGKKTRHTLLNDYVYIFNDLNTERVRIEGVWNDPRELAKFSCSGESFIPCYSASDDFIEDEAVAQQVIERILRLELHILPEKEKYQVKADKDI